MARSSVALLFRKARQKVFPVVANGGLPSGCAVRKDYHARQGHGQHLFGTDSGIVGWITHRVHNDSVEVMYMGLLMRSRF